MGKTIVDRPCRVCSKIPKDGFYDSCINVSNWICPKCHKINVNRVRSGLCPISFYFNYTSESNKQPEDF